MVAQLVREHRDMEARWAAIAALGRTLHERHRAP